MPALQLAIIDHLVFLLLGVAIPLLGISSQQRLRSLTFDTALKTSLYFSNSIALIAMASVVLAVWSFMGRPPAGLGLTYTALPARAWYVLAAFAALYAADMAYEARQLAAKPQKLARWRTRLPFLPETKAEFHAFIPLALSAGICEEIVFRGYFISYWQALLSSVPGSEWLAVLLPAAIFGLTHQYQGAGAVLKVVLMATLFGLFLVWSGTLYPLIAAHALVDIMGGYLSWRLAASAGSDQP